MGNTQYDAAEQWSIAAGIHPFIRRATACTDDDHDTLDPFCGACGLQLNDVGECDECALGNHDNGEFPFCQCCGNTT